ncbi:hypothetical protein ACHMW5_02310 [Azospirillum melinis]|uniref:hypothetical protein n=1 Tax=Azospirillum melinis TaxID=328839 RepID=UPI003757B9D3
MTNGFFNHDNPEARRTLARAESINATFQSVAEGFDKLPAEAEMKQGRVNRATVTGGPTAYAATLPYSPAGYVDGLRFSFKVPSTNTGACTINVNGPLGALGVKSIRRFNGTDPAPNDLTAGAIADVEYDGSVFIIVGAHGASETNAAASAAAAAASQSAAAGSASASAGSASAAAGSASAAAASQSAAAGSASAAAVSASAAAGSASAAAGSATAADQYGSAAGGAAPSVRMNWDAGTSAADPGAGKVRVNNPTVASITAIHISESDAASANLSSVFTAWGGSTNPVKGRLRIGHRLDLTKWIEADVTAVADNGTWWTITVSNPTGPGGFAAADVVAVGLSRAGDKGITSTYWGGTAGGTANALTATTGANLSSLTAGVIIGLTVGATGNSGAATLSVDGLSAIAIRKSGSALAGGELTANTDVWLQYNGTYWRLIGGAGSSGTFTATLSKSSAYTLTAADGGAVIKCTSAIPLTLLAASGAPVAWWVTISNRSTGTVTIAPAGSDTIAGAAAPWVLRSGQDVTIYRTGSSTYEALGLSMPVTDSQATWSAVNKAAGITLSNSNMTATGTSGVGSVLGTVGVSGGKRYFECRLPTAFDGVVGLARSTMSLSSAVGFGDANGWGYIADGRKVNNGTATAYGSSVSDNGVVMVAADIDAGKMWIGINNVWQGSGDPVAGANPTFTGVTGTIYPAFGDQGSGSPSGTLIVGLSSFVYAPPTGYTTFY